MHSLALLATSQLLYIQLALMFMFPGWPLKVAAFATLGPELCMMVELGNLYLQGTQRLLGTCKFGSLKEINLQTQDFSSCLGTLFKTGLPENKLVVG